MTMFSDLSGQLARAGAAALRSVREGNWITADRVAASALVLLASLLCSAAYLAWHLPAWPSDYLGFWAASRLVLDHRPQSAYDPVAHLAVQGAAPGSGWAAFFYPPPALLLCWPLALLPFGQSAAVWQVVTAGLWLASVRRMVPRARGALAAAAASPAAWLNIVAGQNGFLTAGLFGFALDWLDRRPVVAGGCLGCLVYKPQFVIVAPVLLIATGRWRVLAAAAATGAALAAGSVAAFGLGTWRAFLDEPALIHQALSDGAEAPGKMVSVMGMLLSLNFPGWFCYAAQAAATVAACGAMARFARRCDRPAAVGAVLCACSVLASPWLHRYDLVLLAPAIGWIVSNGFRRGFRPWEKSFALAIYVVPYPSLLLGVGAHVSIDVPVTLMLLVMVWRRAFEPAAIVPRKVAAG